MAASFRSVLRSVRHALLPVIVTSLVLFALLEATARVYLFGMGGLIPERINSIRGLPLTGYTQRSSEFRLGFELKPDLDGWFKLAPFRTNSRGLRDREYPFSKPADTFRVAVIGSSFAMPAGVAIEEAFHSRLEEQLSARLAPLRVEFINFAVGTYRPEQLLASLELRALAYEPDLVLVTATSLSAAHFLPMRSGAKLPAPQRIAQLNRAYPVLRSFLVRLIANRVGPAPASWFEEHGVVERLLIEWTDDTPLRPPLAIGALGPKPPERSVTERLADAAREAGIPIVLARLEFDAERELTRAEIELERHARENGAYYVDTRKAFRGLRARDYWIHPLDPHPNAAANAIFAQVLGEFLLANRLVPGGPR